jgi:hypothetical protein
MSTTNKKWTATDLPDLSGRTVVITGASSGLGAIMARELAGAGARVVMAVRDVSKGQSVSSSVTGTTEVRQLDLTRLESIRSFANSWTGEIDVLINNAGVMYAPAGKTTDGFELHIGTNHLGHFALTNLLLPHITTRIVTLTSNLASGGKLDLDDLNWERRVHRRTTTATHRHRQLRSGRIGPSGCGQDQPDQPRRWFRRDHEQGRGGSDRAECRTRHLADTLRRHPEHSWGLVRRAQRPRPHARLAGVGRGTEVLPRCQRSFHALGSLGETHRYERGQQDRMVTSEPPIAAVHGWALVSKRFVSL